MSAALASLLCFPLFIIVCCATVKRWCLYLTKRGIYDTRPGGYGCCVDHWFIPIEDIQEIHARHHAKYLVITIGPEKVKEFVPWWGRPLCFEPDNLIVNHVKNINEFAEAVKRVKTDVCQ